MSFYPRLLEEKKVQSRIINTKLLRSVIDKYPDKYAYMRGDRINNKLETPTEEFVEDLKSVVIEYKLDVDINSFKIIEVGRRNGGISDKYETVSYISEGNEYKIAYAEPESVKNLTSTTTTFKEGMVIYFSGTNEKYKNFDTRNKEKYLELLQKIIIDVKENKINGLDEKDIEQILKELNVKSTLYNEFFLISIFNAMSIGNKIKYSKYVDWIPHRDKYFDELKKKIADDLGYTGKSIDKWCPMDFILIKPGEETKNIIDRKCKEAKDIETESLKLGIYNSMFVNNLDVYDEEKLIIAISLKSETHQSGWGKSYLHKIDPIKDNYNLTKEEKNWDIEKFKIEVVKLREKLRSKLSSSKYYTYRIEKPFDDLKYSKDFKLKYASLKLLDYILSKTDSEINLFIDLTQYILGLGKNPHYFTMIGADSGNYSDVKIKEHKQDGGILIYDEIHRNDIGKITINDKNNTPYISINYTILKGEDKREKLQLWIRSPLGKDSTSVNFGMLHPKEKIVSETFYPKIYEKFTEDSDPISDLGIGMDALIKRWIENETSYSYNKENLLWICAQYGKTEFVKHLIEKGYDVHVNKDYALQSASYYGHTETVKVLLEAGADVHADNDWPLRFASEKGHTETVKVLKDWIAKEKKNRVKESLNEKFTDEDSDPIHDMGIGMDARIKKWIEKNYSIKVENLKEFFHNNKLVSSSPRRIIFELLSHKEIKFLIYLLKNNIIDINELDCLYLRVSAFERKYADVRLLLKLGADLQKAIAYAKKKHEKVTFQELHFIQDNIEKFT